MKQGRNDYIRNQPLMLKMGKGPTSQEPTGRAPAQDQASVHAGWKGSTEGVRDGRKRKRNGGVRKMTGGG